MVKNHKEEFPMMQIPDPIHGYITLEGMYAEIVNTPEFQRLRSIEQGSFRPVFPGARHDRFIHSLGTYHLAAKFADHFFHNLQEDLKIKLPAAREMQLKTTFCYAALLHDIGHAPFSHTTENFFKIAKDPSTGFPRIWVQLCDAVSAAVPLEANLFRNAPKPVGAAHEIASAAVMVAQRNALTTHKDLANVDMALAARMVIGFPYSPSDLAAFAGQETPESLGIRNCLIQLLNNSLLDVDRLDYLGRDTQMSGYFNAPLDLECLAGSVTAVRLDDGWVAPAYRDTALRVFDLMFQAKLSHDAWVLASPAGPYDAALKAHCIRELKKRIHPDYMTTVFSLEALSTTGVTLNGKHYRLLSDVDVSADLKAQSGGAFDELDTRALGVRRIAAWRSYFEYHHIFNDPNNGVTPELVYDFFKPLLKYLDDKHIFIFDKAVYDDICKQVKDPRVLWPAKFLHDYLRGLTSKPDKKDQYNVVLLDRTNNFTMKLDPAQIRITFYKKNMPLRAGKYNYSTYADLTGITKSARRSANYFYLYRHGGLGCQQLGKLCRALAPVIKDAQAKGLI